MTESKFLIMARTFKEAMENRRTYYSISSASTISDEEIQEIVRYAVLHVPSAFNSQTTRVVILFGENHTKLWNIVKEELRRAISDEAFKTSQNKINKCFASGYGTILFFEDLDIVRKLQEQYPTYSENFPVWSQQTSGMHQWAVWTMLEDAGLGASLQHYNPLIDAAVTKEWNLNPHWLLKAQMPFGKPVDEPGIKEFLPLEDRVLVFK
jgi:Predicted oxidoreductase related to nitroreductase